MLARLNRSSGSAAGAAAAGWLVMLAGFLVQAADNPLAWNVDHSLLVAGKLIVGLITLIALYGMLARVGIARGAWQMAALALGVVGVVALTVVTWFTPLWSGLLSATSLIAARRMLSAGVGSKAGFWAFAAAWPLSIGLFVLLDAMQLGRVDEYGDYPWAMGISVAVWCALFAFGLATHAKGLRVEEATEWVEAG